METATRMGSRTGGHRWYAGDTVRFRFRQSPDPIEGTGFFLASGGSDMGAGADVVGLEYLQGDPKEYLKAMSRT